MAIPFAYIAGAGIVAALGFGGQQMGKEIGEKVGRTLPLLGVSALALMAYRQVSK